MQINGKEMTSIHPRSNYGENHFPKVNTSRAPSKDRIQKVIANIRAHLERHPRDVRSQVHVQHLEGRLNQ